jgi:integrase
MSVLPRRFTLTKRCNIYYILYYQNGRQRWKSTGATTKPEALQALARFRELSEQRLQSMSFEQFVSRFLAFIEGNLAEKTVKLYRLVFQSFLLFIHGAYVNEITAETLDRYKAKRLKEVSPVSVNIELRALRAAMSTAKRWRLVAVTPEVSLARVPEQAPLSLSREEFQRLLSLIRENWFRELILFAVCTGLRQAEILNLRWADIDLDRRLVSIESRPTWKTKMGKRRVVPLSETAHVLLCAKLGKSLSEYVFTLNDQKISGGYVSHKFKRYIRAANLSNQRLRFHSLRHSFATWLVQDGVPLAEIQKLLGHSSVQVTEKYSHLAGSELHSAVNRLHVPLN